MAEKLIEYFNRQPRLGFISTSSKDGKVDSAVYGSPQMVDEKTVIVALAKGRTFANLQENPNALFMIMEPGEGILDWRGIRVYLKMKEYIRSAIRHLQEPSRQDCRRASRRDDQGVGYVRSH